MLNLVLYWLVEIFLVEDSFLDVKLIVIVLCEVWVVNNLYVVVDGVTVMDYLWYKGEFVDELWLDFILLDLNLFWKDGWEVFVEIKEDEELCGILVIIFIMLVVEFDVLWLYML